MDNCYKHVQELISHITYKPGWQVRAHLHGVHIIVEVNCKTADVHTGKETVLCSSVPYNAFEVAGMDDWRIIHDVIFPAIRRLEHHEMDEWFKFDGRCVVEPHPEKYQKA